METQFKVSLPDGKNVYLKMGGDLFKPQLSSNQMDDILRNLYPRGTIEVI